VRGEDLERDLREEIKSGEKNGKTMYRDQLESDAAAVKRVQDHYY